MDVMLRYVGFAILGGFAAAIVVGILNGTINTAHLLERRRKGAPPAFSLDRAQLLVATLAFAALYLFELPDSVAAGGIAPVSSEVVIALGGSNGLYLVSKLASRLRKPSAA